MRRNTQGCPELSDDLWYLILAKQDLFTLLTSCQPVCRSWTSIARELTSTRFYLECNLEPDKVCFFEDNAVAAENLHGSAWHSVDQVRCLHLLPIQAVMSIGIEVARMHFKLPWKVVRDPLFDVIAFYSPQQRQMNCLKALRQPSCGEVRTCKTSHWCLVLSL